ncbi:hypothetical protein [Lysinibacillus sp. NPDC047702]|uniref:hypothetical protein n=1 Tax=unclassified Lysinibacillus TaxID=2636778 RepID=UPI003D04D1F6
MKLANAVSKIAELPLVLEQYGIPHKNVLSVQYNYGALDDADILVNLHQKENIQKLGICEEEKTIGHDDANWTHFRIVKDGISFVCWERESQNEAIA